MKEREVAIIEGQLQRIAADDQARLQLDAAKAANRDKIERERISTQAEIAGARISQATASDLLENAQDDKKQALEEYKLGLDMAKEVVKDITTNE